jgi:hypothetical protein
LLLENCGLRIIFQVVLVILLVLLEHLKKKEKRAREDGEREREKEKKKELANLMTEKTRRERETDRFQIDRQIAELTIDLAKDLGDAERTC